MADLLNDLFGPQGEKRLIDDLFGAQAAKEEALGEQVGAALGTTPAPKPDLVTAVDAVAAPKTRGQATIAARRAAARPQEDSWGEVGTKFVENLPDRAKTWLGGLAQFTGEMAEKNADSPIFGSQWARDIATAVDRRIAAAGKELSDEGRAELERNAPEFGESGINNPKRYAYEVANAFVDLGAAFAVTAATRNPTAGASVIGGQVFGDQYDESRRTGRTHEQAFQDAAFMGATELVTERIPLGILLKPGGKFLGRVMKGAAAESIQEAVTEVLQTGYDVGVLNENMTWGEAVRQVIDAGIVGGAAGGGIAAVSAPFVKEEGAQESPPVALTPEDQASPIPDDLIRAGKQVLADVEAQADPVLDPEAAAVKVDAFMRDPANSPAPTPEEALAALDARRDDPVGQEASAAAPVATPVATPRRAAADAPGRFDRMVQITLGSESGNRDLDANGNVLTSPAGAKGKMQVLDGTNTDPGFGVRPATDNSLAERARVGRDYLAAMLKRYGGDPAKMWAAYNWGPGALDNAIAEHGDDWLDHAPAETRKYVFKNLNQLGGDAFNAETGEIAPVSEAEVEAAVATEETAEDFVRRVLGDDALDSAAPADVPAQSDAQMRAEQGFPEPTTGLDAMGAGMADAISANLRKTLLDKLDKGDLTENGQPSAILQVMQRIRDRNGTVNDSTFQAIATEYAKAPASGPERQAALAKVVDRFAATPLPGTAGATRESEEIATRLRDYIRERGNALKADAIAKALDISREQADRALGSLASRPNSGIFITKAGDVRRLPARTGPIDVITFLRDRGGVQSGSHDLRNHAGVGRYPGLINNKGGMSLDQAGELLTEAQYLPGETWTEDDVLDLLDRATTRGPVYKPSESAEVEPTRPGEQTEEEARADIEDALSAYAIIASAADKERMLSRMAAGADAETAVFEHFEEAARETLSENETLAEEYDIPFAQGDESDVNYLDPAEEAGGADQRAPGDSRRGQAGERLAAEEGAAPVADPEEAGERPAPAAEGEAGQVTVEDMPSGKSVIVRGASPAQLDAIRAALPEKVQPLENKRAGGIVYSKKHEDKIRGALRRIEQRRPPNKTTEAPVRSDDPIEAASNVFAYALSNGTDGLPSQINPATWVDQMEEQIDNPGRYHRIEQIDNPLGLKIGDRVRLKKNPDVEAYVVTFTTVGDQIQVKVQPTNSYGGFYKIEDVEKVGGKAPSSDFTKVVNANLTRDQVTAAAAVLAAPKTAREPEAGATGDIGPGARFLSAKDRALFEQLAATRRVVHVSRRRDGEITVGISGTTFNLKDARVRARDALDFGAPAATFIDRYRAMHEGFEGLVMVRFGDFFEFFEDDARTAARVLDIALTTRKEKGGEEVAMAGIPQHAAEGYAARLARAGYRVGIGTTEGVSVISSIEPEAEDKSEAAPRPAAYGSKNKLVSVDRAAELRERLKAKLSGAQLNAGLDPELIALGTELAVFHIEAGARRFADFSKAMADDLGMKMGDLKRYLRGWYNGARDMLEDAGEDVDGMDGPGAVKAALTMIEDAPVTRIESPDRNQDDSNDPLVRAFIDAFAAGTSFATITEARAFASNLTGETYAAGTPAAKALDEAIEEAVVGRARQIATWSARGDRGIYDRLVELYAQQPRLGVRTSTSVEQQAFSTPVPLGFLAQRLADVSGDTTIYEPSAGNGALVFSAFPSTVTANEINADRAAVLKRSGYKVTQKDAAKAVPAEKFDVILANPPFGTLRDEAGDTTTFNVDGRYRTNEIDHAIALKALEAMKDDGRAVLLVGGINKQITDPKKRSDAYNGKAKREFYFTLYGAYNVVDHFTVAGELYERQGAGWPVDVIVIEGRGKSARPLPAAQVPQIYDSWDGLSEKLNVGSTENARPARNPDRNDLGEGGRAAGADVGNPRGSGSGGDNRRGGERADGQFDGVRNGPADGQPAGVRVDAEREGMAEAAPDRDTRGPAGRDQGTVDELGENARQVAYTPGSSAPQMGTLVPVNMQTSIDQALDDLRGRVGDIDAFVADRLGYSQSEMFARFGGEQVDAIALAIDNIERGAGFIIGDQTGIGKGRVVAAVIRYAIRQDRAPIFVTEKPNLYKDMFRDMTDIGIPEMLGRDVEIMMTNAATSVPLDDDGVLKLKSPAASVHNKALVNTARKGLKASGVDVLFTTYSQMQSIGGEPTERQKAIRRIAKGGVLILDESHNAGGQGPSMIKPKKGADGNVIAPSRAEFVRELVGLAHGVFYSSATYAKRPDVMDLYAATDMRLAVDDMSKLGEAIAKGGVPMQQIVAAMLARAGQYVRRERSFDGIAYNTPQIEIDPRQYEAACAILKSIQMFSEGAAKDAAEALNEDLKGSAENVAFDGSIGGAGAASTNFTAIMHNVIDQMLLAFVADDAANRAIDAINAGEKPVITVANTLEAFLTQLSEEDGVRIGQAIDISFADVFRRYLERSRWVTVRKPFMDKGEKGERVRLTDAQLGPNGVRAFKGAMEMIDRAGLETLPGSPLDHIVGRIEDAGFKVAEITGRTLGLNYRDGKAYLKARGAADKSIDGRIKSITGFNDGRVDAMLLNQSGATGLSLHASATFKDRRKRRMIIAQPERNIDTHMQVLGRVHRTGQVVLPEYDQLVVNVPAQKRPASVLAKKMASLNANTTASRDSAVTAKDVPDFMNAYGDEVAARIMEEEPDIHDALGHPLKEEEEGYARDGAMRKVTGRIPLLPVVQQEEVYQRLEEEYALLLANKEAAGENALEARTFDLDARVEASVEAVAGKGGSSPFAAPVMVETASIKRLGKPHSSETVQAMVAEGKADQPNLVTWRGEGVQFMRREIEKATENAKASTRTRLTDNIDRWDALTRITKPGESVKLKTDNGNLYGIVTSLDRTGNPKNPLALGSWKATIALVDASRQMTLPLSQLAADNGGASVPGKIMIERATKIGDIPIAEAFDRIIEGRETRNIITGNILSGFDFMNGRGAIINFTDSEGAVRQGIMAARGWDFERHKATKSVPITDHRAVVDFISMSNAGITGKGRAGDVVLQLLPQRGEFIVSVSKSKKAGGEFFLNRDLTRALGTDFVSTSSGMVARTRADAAGPAIQVMMKAGVRFEIPGSAADDVKDRAREVMQRYGARLSVVAEDAPPRLTVGPRITSFGAVDTNIVPGATISLSTPSRFNGRQAVPQRPTVWTVRETDDLITILDPAPGNDSAPVDLVTPRLREALRGRTARIVATGPRQGVLLSVAKDGFDFDAIQPERTMTQAQRAELEARKQQSKARRGGQQGLGDQEGGLFSSERDQGSLFSVSRQNDRPLSRDTQQRLTAELRKIVGGDRVLLAVTNRLNDDSKIAGQYFAGMIRIATEAPQSVDYTLDHEAIHALKDMGLFRSAEWTALTRRATSDTAFMDEIRRRYAPFDLTEEQIEEEAVAELFAGWRAGRRETGFVRAALQRIADFFAALRRALGVGDLADTVLREIDSGAIGRRPDGEVGGFADAARMARMETTAFERWFGNSKVVDEDGLPLVVYHGTAAAIEAFDPSAGAKNRAGNVAGFYFTPSQSEAKDYGPKVVSAYLSIQNPYVPGELIMTEEIEAAYRNELVRKNGHLDPAGDADWFDRKVREAEEDGRISSQALNGDGEAMRRVLKAGGYDGYQDGRHWTAFEPTQIKSTANRGTWDANDPRIMNMVGDHGTPHDSGRAAKALVGNGKAEAITERLDQWRTNLQDRMLPLLRTQQRIEREQGKPVAEALNAYRAEELMSGKVGSRLEKLTDDMVTPLFETMKIEGVSVEELETYLYARHAPERNARIAEINPEFEEGTGSGMSDAEAAAIMERIEAEGKLEPLKRAAKRVDSILNFAVQTRIEAGLLSEEEADAWRETYRNYVPLRGQAEIEPESGAAERPRRGSGINVRGSESRRAFGRKSRADNILAYSLMQAEEAIVRAGTNEVAQTFYQLVKANPDPDFWTVNKVSRKPIFNKKTGQVSYRSENRIAAEDAPYTISLKIDGREHRVTMNRANPQAARLAESMRNLNGVQMGGVMKVLSGINRFLSFVNTGLNPEFVITNAFRDIQTAGVNLKQFDKKGLVRGVLKDYPAALKASVQGAFKKGSGEWGEAYREFVAEGGRVYFNRVEDLNELQRRIEREFADRSPTASTARKAASALFSFIEQANIGVENAVRLSAFKNARERGMSASEAASLAKNLTVNFNRRGAWGVAMNSLYLFYNASVQGSVRMLQAMKSKSVRKLLYGAIATGAALEMLNMMVSGVDDDDELYYDKISDFDKSRNLIFMIPGGEGRHIKIPLPYGYNSFFAMGRAGAEIARGRRWQESGSALLTTIVDSFNPIGGTESIINFIAPTVADPIVDLERNRDFADRPIMPEQNQFGPPTPDNQRYWSSVSPHWRVITDFLNSTSGGDEVVPGAIDVSPETLEHLSGVVTGAAGTFFIDRMGGLVEKVATGEDVTANDLPLARKVIGAKPVWYDKAAYYARADEIEQAQDYVKTYRENGDYEAADAFEESNAELLAMGGAVKRSKKALKALRGRRGEAELMRDRDEISAADYRAIRDEISEEEKMILTDFNSEYLALIEKPKRP